jgi:hypothetical protein
VLQTMTMTDCVSKLPELFTRGADMIAVVLSAHGVQSGTCSPGCCLFTTHKPIATSLITMSNVVIAKKACKRSKKRNRER